ncbi:hypothetical protein [Pseudonocardia spinosispora]|uniref:hypothetical protein n=1 Tax=Pseudonocardia spinosispora TaxID=103441 RepID=UPI00041D1B77|nr:hypothetical protein [Pseudonocardia spinosispora]
MTEPHPERVTLPTIAERLIWLFEVLCVRVADPRGGEPRWRPYNTAEVGLGMSPRLDNADVATCVTTVERVRAGGEASDRELAAIAAFFDAPADYFGLDPIAVTTIQDALLDRALRECDVQSYLLCRGPAVIGSQRRNLLRRALQLLRRGFEQAARHKPTTNLDVRRTTDGAACDDHLQDHTEEDRTNDDEERAPSYSMWPRATGGTVSISQQRPKSELQLRVFCQGLLQDLDILPPLTPQNLCRKLSSARGRPIRPAARELPATASVGLLVPKPDRDMIYYQKSAPREQRIHVIYHEVMHLLLGHLEGAEMLTCGALDEATRPGDGLYSRWKEWEAETGATILSELTRRRADPRLITKASPQAEQGIAAAFGLSTSGWR